MSNLHSAFEHLLLQLAEAGIDTARLHESDELFSFRFFARNYPHALMLYDFRQMQPMFASPLFSKLVQDESGNADKLFLEAMTHPDSEKEFSRWYFHFHSGNSDMLCDSYHFKTAENKPLLLYGCSQCISFDENGKAAYILSIFFPVDYLLGLSLQNGEAKKPFLSREMFERFKTLTITEIKMLDLMLQDKTDIDISTMHGCSCENVRTHRSNILKKLGLNTPTGLAKYGVFF